MTGEAIFLGITAGDWLQALVTVIAVIATIRGTLYIERQSREAASVEDMNRVRAAVKAIQHAAGAIRAGLPDDATNYQHYSQSMTMQTELKVALDMYRFVRADAKVKDLRLWQPLKNLDEVIGKHGQTIESELRSLATSGHHTSVFNINRDKVMAASAPIDDAAKAALTAAN